MARRQVETRPEERQRDSFNDYQESLRIIRALCVGGNRLKEETITNYATFNSHSQLLNISEKAKKEDYKGVSRRF